MNVNKTNNHNKSLKNPNRNQRKKYTSPNFGENSISFRPDEFRLIVPKFICSVYNYSSICLGNRDPTNLIYLI